MDYFCNFAPSKVTSQPPPQGKAEGTKTHYKHDGNPINTHCIQHTTLRSVLVLVYLFSCSKQQERHPEALLHGLHRHVRGAVFLPCLVFYHWALTRVGMPLDSQLSFCLSFVLWLPQPTDIKHLQSSSSAALARAWNGGGIGEIFDP